MKKEENDAVKEAILDKLREQEVKRREEVEYIENLRNELYLEESEEQAR